MARPQSPELHRSGKTPGLDPDNAASRLEAKPQPGASGVTGPVPEDNQPGHHPEHEQDKPDPDAFVERFRHPPTIESESEPEIREGADRTKGADRTGEHRTLPSTLLHAACAGTRMAASAAGAGTRLVTSSTAAAMRAIRRK